MTATQIWTAVQNIRFNSSILSTDGGIKDWVRAREAEVWQYAPWPIKESALLNLTVVAGTATVALPAGISFPWQELEIYDENGERLDYLPESVFYKRYLPYVVPSVSPGPGEAWTFTTDLSASPAATLQVRIGPVPSTSRTYEVRGWSLPISRSAASTYKIGTMSAGSDLPWWADDFHYFLVSGALALGKQQQSDPTWQADEQAFQLGLERLASSIFDSSRLVGQQWGAWRSDWC